LQAIFQHYLQSVISRIGCAVHLMLPDNDVMVRNPYENVIFPYFEYAENTKRSTRQRE
jgi:hypothetical protein